MSEYKRAVAYIRVSQEDEKPENQKEVILKWAREHGIDEVFFFPDRGVSGAVPPRERPMYKLMIDFAKENNIKLILFYDLSRLSRNLEDGLLELKKLIEEGFTFKFVAQEFLDYIDDPALRKKVISDFLWFAELYRRDIIKRTKDALARLRAEGKLVHRPRLIHYVALYLSNKERFADLTDEDMDRAKQYIINLFKKYVDVKIPIKELYKMFLEHFGPMYESEKTRKAPRSYEAFRKLLDDVGLVKSK